MGETDGLNSRKCFHGANNIFNSKSKKLEIVIVNGVQKLRSVMCSSVMYSSKYWIFWCELY